MQYINTAKQHTYTHTKWELPWRVLTWLSTQWLLTKFWLFHEFQYSLQVICKWPSSHTYTKRCCPDTGLLLRDHLRRQIKADLKNRLESISSSAYSHTNTKPGSCWSPDHEEGSECLLTLLLRPFTLVTCFPFKSFTRLLSLLYTEDPKTLVCSRPCDSLFLVITPGNWLLNLSGPCLRLRDQTTCPSQTDAEAYGSK